MNEILQQRIEEASINYTMMTKPICIAGDAFADMAREINKNPAFIAGANFALQNQWISVDDESPKESGTYFIKTKIGYGIAIYSCNGGWFDIDGKPFTKITHWMEIPTLQPSEQLP